MAIHFQQTAADRKTEIWFHYVITYIWVESPHVVELAEQRRVATCHVHVPIDTNGGVTVAREWDDAIIPSLDSGREIDPLVHRRR